MKKTLFSKNWYLDSGDWGCGPVDLPNDYSVTAGRSPHAPGGGSTGFFNTGEAWYSKNVEFDPTPKHYILDIDGAYMCAYVECNHQLLGMHPYGYTPVLYDLTGYVKPGERNLFKIHTNALQTSTRWYSGAGLFRDIYLWEGGDIRIEPWDKFISTPDTNTVNAVYTISADRDAVVLLRCDILDGEELIATLETAAEVKAGEKTPVALSFLLTEAKLWTPDTPNLYTMRATVMENDTILDTDDTRFGIRTVTVDAVHGMQLNGETIKLRGGCIHHDHGVLGAADYPAACRRKLTKLKDAGFNALRMAHNPPSLNLLELCDEIGLIVMDEAFDCWRRMKGGPFNYHLWFDGWWDKDISYMVLRDRNHPCIFTYSTGNEIPESGGWAPDGGEWCAKLAAEIRKYDNTRPVTSATFQMGDGETWADRTESYFAPLDLAGYNYAYERYEADHQRFPNRVIWGSETHALNFYHSWSSVLRNPYVIGDFTWTAWDNLGEVGTGRALWARDGEIHGISLSDYPWRSCYQGDFDLAGYRRPQSYFREAVWLGGTEPRIFTTHPEHYGEGYTGTGWHWYDVLDTWTFDDRYLGKPVKCEVYTDADLIVWFLNGREVGRTATDCAIATCDIPYEKGELSVVAYKNGKEVGKSSLHTVGAPVAVKVVPETHTLAADHRDLCYFDLSVVDENGDRIPDAAHELHCGVTGGELLGIFGGDPKNEDRYGSPVCHAFEGRAVAIVRTKTPGEVTVTVLGPGLKPGSATVTAR